MVLKAEMTIRGLSQIQAKLKRLNKPPSQRVMEETAEAGAVFLVRRVQIEGKDRDGNRLRPYSPDYAKRRGRGGKRVQPPNLTITGRMLNSLQPVSYSSSASGSDIRLAFVGSAARRSLGHNGELTGPIRMISSNKLAFIHNKTRKFFGFTNSEEDKTRKVFKALYLGELDF